MYLNMFRPKYAMICFVVSLLTCVLCENNRLVGFGSDAKFTYPYVFNQSPRDEIVPGLFPRDFKFGIATAAYQIEGGWDADGRGPSIWDTFTHEKKGRVHKNENGDDATKSYFKWDEDVRILQSLGVDFYRFSLSWSRILPSGFYRSESDINQAGVKFYNFAIDSLIAAKIEPMVTLYHWDLPQGLQDEGGLLSPDFPKWFSDYARFCYALFGDRVKKWATFNEPMVTSEAFDYGHFAPGIVLPGVGVYISMHQQLLAHQAAYHIYNEEFRGRQKGEVGLVANCAWTEPADASPQNIAAADRANEFNCGIVLSPLVGTGDYPDIVKFSVAEHSQMQGLAKSRLPQFTEEEKQRLLGSVDFIGLNYYATDLGENEPFNVSLSPVTFYKDAAVRRFPPNEWPFGASSWFHIAPYGFRNMLNWVQKRYGSLGTPWYITENGYSDYPEDVPCSNTMDIDKTKYIVSHIHQVYRAVTEDNIRIKGFTMWSLLDNFEWADGYSKKFGLYCVNLDDPDRFRYPRYSASVYRKILTFGGFSLSLMKELEMNQVLEHA